MTFLTGEQLIRGRRLSFARRAIAADVDSSAIDSDLFVWTDRRGFSRERSLAIR